MSWWCHNEVASTLVIFLSHFLCIFLKLGAGLTRDCPMGGFPFFWATVWPSVFVLHANYGTSIDYIVTGRHGNQYLVSWTMIIIRCTNVLIGIDMFIRNWYLGSSDWYLRNRNGYPASPRNYVQKHDETIHKRIDHSYWPEYFELVSLRLYII